MRRLSRLAVAAVVALPLVACTSTGIFSLEVGQCFQDPGGDAEVVTDIEVVDCEEPHDNEVFHAFDLEGDDFPGQDAATAAAEDECYGATFEDYVGQPFETSEVEVFAITPTRESWEEADDREVVCALKVPGERVEGSLRGSGR